MSEIYYLKAGGYKFKNGRLSCISRKSFMVKLGSGDEVPNCFEPIILENRNVVFGKYGLFVAIEAGVKLMEVGLSGKFELQIPTIESADGLAENSLLILYGYELLKGICKPEPQPECKVICFDSWKNSKS